MAATGRGNCIQKRRQRAAEQTSSSHQKRNSISNFLAQDSRTMLVRPKYPSNETYFQAKLAFLCNFCLALESIPAAASTTPSSSNSSLPDIDSLRVDTYTVDPAIYPTDGHVDHSDTLMRLTGRFFMHDSRHEHVRNPAAMRLSRTTSSPVPVSEPFFRLQVGHFVSNGVEAERWSERQRFRRKSDLKWIVMERVECHCVAAKTDVRNEGSAHPLSGH